MKICTIPFLGHKTAKAVSSVATMGDWHLSFHIPARNSFSNSVQTSIDTGVVSARARREIVQTLRTLVLQYTRYLSSEQYNAVCSSLVQQFPTLKDSIGSGYVSLFQVKVFDTLVL